jgi:biotin carboxyl carrier protein
MEESQDRNVSLLNDEYLVDVEGEEYRITLEAEGTARINKKVYSYDLAKIDERAYSLMFDSKSYFILFEDIAAGSREVRLCLNGQHFAVTVDDKRSLLQKSLLRNRPHVHESQTIRAPMPGLVVKVQVQVGQVVKTGEGLAILEAMKMENEINAVQSGRVEAVHVKAGKVVEKGEPLISLIRD